MDMHLTSAEKVIVGLRSAITSGTLPAGEQIRQEKIAAEYSVSRMPVREAFRQLEAEGLLIIYPGRGAFINRLTNAEISEICDIRILLECDAMRRAVPVLTQIAMLEADLLIQKMSIAKDGQTFGKLDEAFHDVLYAPTERPRLIELIRTLRNQVTQFLYAATPIEVYSSNSIAEHRQILDACRAGDVNAAVNAIEIHLRNTLNHLTT